MEPTAEAPTGAGVRLLADDLTGACDASAPFLAAGHSVRVWLGAKALFPAAETAQAFQTGSRALAAEAAAESVARAAAGLERDTGTVLFKKIDSAGRGPIAAEVLAAHQALGTRAILFAPGFPAAGRTVRDGVLEIQDASGQSVRVNLPELFDPEMRGAIALLQDANEIAPAIGFGKTILLCDCAAQEDLNDFARAAEPLRGLLYAGSAGLAWAIASLHPAAEMTRPLARAERAMVVAGTTHPVTARQLEELERAAGGRRDVKILRIECARGDDDLVREAFASFDPEALILTGGDTALLAAEALGAHSLLLEGELAAGIPWGRLQGGAAQGRITVTKSGGFGAASALYELVTKLTGAA
jgi:uncharacterized protein YgbK (DUF1537 family)